MREEDLKVECCQEEHVKADDARWVCETCVTLCRLDLLINKIWAFLFVSAFDVVHRSIDECHARDEIECIWLLEDVEADDKIHNERPERAEYSDISEECLSSCPLPVFLLLWNAIQCHLVKRVPVQYFRSKAANDGCHDPDHNVSQSFVWIEVFLIFIFSTLSCHIEKI